MIQQFVSFTIARIAFVLRCRKEEEKPPQEEDPKALELKKRRERLMQWKASNKLQLNSLLEAFGSEDEPKKKGKSLI
jgi:hypothetical protein